MSFSLGPAGEGAECSDTLAAVAVYAENISRHGELAHEGTSPCLLGEHENGLVAGDLEPART
jgi:hypothetical protein